jgi:hypothetical protein
MSNSKSDYDERPKWPREPSYGGKTGTALIDGFTFLSKPVQYVVVDGMAIVEGDINLGPVESVERSFEMRQAELTGRPVEKAIVITPGSQFGWPNCVIPYQINAGLPNQNRVTDAIAHWEANTDFSFVLRTAGNANQFPDYVEFVTGSECQSAVGRRTGRQFLSVTDGCSTGNVIHEIGHAAGLWHEQSRLDRDAYVTIIWDNIIPFYKPQFAPHITDGDDVGKYDYGSIMHYSRTAFTVNGQDTIVPTDPDTQIGQRDGLSAGDILAVNTVLCPKVPACLDLTAVVAIPMIHAVGLLPKILGAGDVPGAWVWRQKPPPGTSVDRGSTVTLQTRTGPIP